MGKKITIKLILAYFAAAVSMFILLNIYGARQLETSLLQSRKELLYQEAVLIATDYGENYYKTNATLQDLKKQLKSIDQFIDVRVMMTNVRGTVFIDTRSEESLQLTDYAEDLFSYQYIENLYAPGLSSSPVLIVTEPFYSNYTIRGYVCLVVTMDSIDEDTVYYMNFINKAYLIFLLVLFVIFVWVYIAAVWPLRFLKQSAVMYARGNYSYRPKVRFYDEYKEIAEAMQYTVEEVERLEQYQKKFVANVSHDFRSPLTSIKGYVEAIKDGTIPYEAQERYLDVILFETDRLTKLTTDLLNLNRMDTKAELEISVFDLNEMIKKTAASFEGVCTKKKITLDLIFSSDKTYVSADFSRIQQVLYNLLDNAIKFSNQDSTVVISVEEKGSKAFTSMKDFGIGIPKDAIKKIWERFYKTDLSRGKDKRGTGLGLSITKEIIQAHNENINVISTEGVGTEFIFSLPRAEQP